MLGRQLPELSFKVPEAGTTVFPLSRLYSLLRELEISLTKASARNTKIFFTVHINKTRLL